eukprot:6476911-Amphidinium_carterae.2
MNAFSGCIIVARRGLGLDRQRCVVMGKANVEALMEHPLLAQLGGHPDRIRKAAEQVAMLSVVLVTLAQLNSPKA